MDTIYTPILLTRDEYIRQNPHITVPFTGKTPAIGNIVKACLADGQTFWAIIEDRIYRATNESTAYIARIDTNIIVYPPIDGINNKKISIKTQEKLTQEKLYGTRIHINPANIIDII